MSGVRRRRTPERALGADVCGVRVCFFLVFWVLFSVLFAAFEVFWSNQGAQGLLGRPSKQQLENVFGTHRDDEVVKQVLEKGTAQASEGIKNSNFGSTNVAMGSLAVDSKGKGLRGI